MVRADTCNGNRTEKYVGVILDWEAILLPCVVFSMTGPSIKDVPEPFVQI
jgi:hypothetical protein